MIAKVLVPETGDSVALILLYRCAYILKDPLSEFQKAKS